MNKNWALVIIITVVVFISWSGWEIYQLFQVKKVVPITQVTPLSPEFNIEVARSVSAREQNIPVKDNQIRPIQ